MIFEVLFPKKESNPRNKIIFLTDNLISKSAKTKKKGEKEEGIIMADIERRCMSIVLLSLGLFALVSCQMFDKKPTVYDHMKSGANTVKTNLVESELKIQTEVCFHTIC